MKVMTIVGTRPELIKLSLVIPAMDSAFEHILVHTGQNFDFELNEIFFRDLSLRRPDHFLNCAAGSAIQTIAQVLVKTEEILLKEKPDALLLYGDTNSCLAVLSAKKLQIPVFHMEAGNRCFDERVPEEINRRVVDHLSDLNMPLTEFGRRNLLNEGLPPERVLKTGSCMFEILKHFADSIDRSTVLMDLKLNTKEYFVVSCHREENVDSPDRLKVLLQALTKLSKDFKKEAVFSVHPRTQKRIDALGGAGKTLQMRMLKPLGFFDYVKLQKESFCVLSDSGTLMEESSILGFPAVHCRDSFERPEGMECGTLVVSPINEQRLKEAVRIVTAGAGTKGLVADYHIDGVAMSVVRIIQTYTPAIDRNVWRR